MKVLIIEDEKLAADHLSGLLLKYDSTIEVLARIDTVKKGIEWFSSQTHPDLAFFDIQLADGISFEIFEKVTVNCPIIFTTAFNEYAIKAFKVNSVDYLLKPIDFDELEAAINKYRQTHQKLQDNKYQEVFENVMTMLTDSYKERFAVKVGEHIKSIIVSDILYFYSMEKATFLHTTGDRTYVIDYSVEQLENLVNPKQFFRINRKYLININAIEDIISYSNSRLKVELLHSKEMDAIVAREKVGKFKQWLDR